MRDRERRLRCGRRARAGRRLPLTAAANELRGARASGSWPSRVARRRRCSSRGSSRSAIRRAPDSAALVAELRSLGVRTVMVTGDAPATAAIVARAVGLEGAMCPPGPIRDAVRPEQFAVFAGVLPEDKFQLVKAVPERRAHGRHVRRRRQRRARAAPGADGHRRIDRDRRRQVGRRHRADQHPASPASSLRSRKAHHVPAHPHLHAELGHQEDRAGAASSPSAWS